MLPSAITLSILLSFASAELLGLLSGGLITSGYLAFYLDQPLRLALTYGAGGLCYLLVRLISRHTLLYGRRRYALSLLMGYALGFLLSQLMRVLPDTQMDLRIIGYLLPGLIANDMMRQGFLKTVLTSLSLSLIIRLILMLGGL